VSCRNEFVDQIAAAFVAQNNRRTRTDIPQLERYALRIPRARFGDGAALDNRRNRRVSGQGGCRRARERDHDVVARAFGGGVVKPRGKPGQRHVGGRHARLDRAGGHVDVPRLIPRGGGLVVYLQDCRIVRGRPRDGDSVCGHPPNGKGFIKISYSSTYQCSGVNVITFAVG